MQLGIEHQKLITEQHQRMEHHKLGEEYQELEIKHLELGHLELGTEYQELGAEHQKFGN